MVGSALIATGEDRDGSAWLRGLVKETDQNTDLPGQPTAPQMQISPTLELIHELCIPQTLIVSMHEEREGGVILKLVQKQTLPNSKPTRQQKVIQKVWKGSPELPRGNTK
jgi:hypothetical protein